MPQATFKEVIRKLCLHSSSQVGEIEDMVEWPTDSGNIYNSQAKSRAFLKSGKNLSVPLSDTLTW